MGIKLLIWLAVENAWTLGQHKWNREMLEEAGGEFIFLNVRRASFMTFCYVAETLSCFGSTTIYARPS